jgi:hypothetical protein
MELELATFDNIIKELAKRDENIIMFRFDGAGRLKTNVFMATPVQIMVARENINHFLVENMWPTFDSKTTGDPREIDD